MRSVRTLVVDPKPIADDRQAVGEVKPRYESDLSFRVAGKVLARRVDVGASRQTRRHAGNARHAGLPEPPALGRSGGRLGRGRARRSPGDEARKAKLLKDGWTPKATYDTALRNLRSAEARLTSAKANLDLTRDQLALHGAQGRVRRCDHRRRRRAGPERQCRPDGGEARPPGDKDAVFNIAETAFTDQRATRQPKSSSGRCPTRSCASTASYARSLRSPTPTTRTYTVKVTLKDPPPQLRFGMSIAGRWKGSSALLVCAPPLRALRKERHARRLGRSIRAPAASR